MKKRELVGGKEGYLREPTVRVIELVWREGLSAGAEREGREWDHGWNWWMRRTVGRRGCACGSRGVGGQSGRDCGGGVMAGGGGEQGGLWGGGRGW